MHYIHLYILLYKTFIYYPIQKGIILESVFSKKIGVKIFENRYFYKNNEYIFPCLIMKLLRKFPFLHKKYIILNISVMKIITYFICRPRE